MPARSYQITFRDKEAKPIAGVSASCKGNGIWPSQEIAQEINGMGETSNSSGILKIAHSGYEVGGTYNEFGPFTWGDNDHGKVYCKFLHQGLIIESGELAMYNQPVEVMVPTII